MNSFVKIISSFVAVAFVFLFFPSCVFFSSQLILADYSLYGDESTLNGLFEDGILTLGQKGSGQYIDEFQIDFNSGRNDDIELIYRSHVQGTVGTGWVSSGTKLQFYDSQYPDTLQLILVGEDAFKYDICYRVSFVGTDWSEWVSNGTMVGTPNESLPIEAVEIKLNEIDDYRSCSWILTEFADDSGNQAMFYTLKNNIDGTLIVVDGGWDANVTQVRSIINLFGGRVDHWFLTHYDEDHVSVFNAIYQDPQGIEIGSVYATPLDYDYYASFAEERWWDTPWIYETFLEQTEGDDRIHYLSRGDEFMIDGLIVDVFNSFDQVIIDTGNADVANYSSLMFKITGLQDSVLFCGDVHGRDITAIILEMYGDELDAEYVQPSHHGNAKVPPEFYEAVGAQVMLFDGPPGLVHSEEHRALALWNWCADNGVEAYEYVTAPNYFPFD